MLHSIVRFVLFLLVASVVELLLLHRLDITVEPLIKDPPRKGQLPNTLLGPFSFPDIPLISTLLTSERPHLLTIERGSSSWGDVKDFICLHVWNIQSTVIMLQLAIDIIFSIWLNSQI